MNIKGKVTMGALLVALASGGTYVVASQTAQTVNDAINTVTAHNEEMHQIAVKERQIEVNALAAQLAIEAESARLDLVAKEAELARERAMSDARAVHTLNRDQELAWVWTGSKGLLYGLVGVVPTAVGGLILWRVITVKRREDEDRKLVEVVASGAMPVSREFLLSHPEALFEMVQIKAEQAARVEIAKAAQISLPSLTTYTHSPSYSPTNDKDLLLVAKAQEERQEESSSQGVGDGEKSSVIFEALQMQGVPSYVSLVAVGPQCETYAIKPGRIVSKNRMKRVTVNQIVKHAADVAMALGVPSVRMAQSAGFIACEVAREEREFVSLGGIFKSEEWAAAMREQELPLALGVNTMGERIIEDLCRMPHFLLGGATNMGKSVAIVSLITSLCQQPESKVKLTLIDPKEVEFEPFHPVPHVAKIVTDMEQAAHTLETALTEMNRRTTLFKKLKVQKITEYNKKAKTPLPYIVIIIDELADLMATNGDEVEEMIVRLAQKARFAGIHLILATQRPDAETVTPLIRANMPARLSVRCMASGDSKTILGEVGAEKLLDRGDALFKSALMPLTRLQCSFMETKEAINGMLLAQKANNAARNATKQARNSGEIIPTRPRNSDEITPTRVSVEVPDVLQEAVDDARRKQLDMIDYKDAAPEERAAFIKILHTEGLSKTAIQKRVWGNTGGHKHKERKAEIERAIADVSLNGRSAPALCQA